MASTFEFIEKQTLGSDAAAIDFTSVTQAYEHLQVRIHGKSTYGGLSDDARISFNRSNTIGTWDQQYMYGMYSTDGVGELFSSYDATWLTRLAGNSGTSVYQRGVIVITISDYANTSKRASIQWYGGNVSGDNNNQGKQISMGGAAWSETTAISEIRIRSGSASLKAGTSVAIYGMKSS